MTILDNILESVLYSTVGAFAKTDQGYSAMLSYISEQMQIQCPGNYNLSLEPNLNNPYRYYEIPTINLIFYSDEDKIEWMLKYN